MLPTLIWPTLTRRTLTYLFLHKIFIDEAADFASVGAAQLRRRPHDLDGPVLPVNVGPGDLVLQVEPVSEEVTDRLWRTTRKPLEERLRVVPEKPFDIHLQYTIELLFMMTVNNIIWLLQWNGPV